ncbi:MAG: thiamine pyrophosphate-binding protein, partial [Chloroflexota bacterium]|nr:thiamine pyrophosphate-binding protein [Chloroflexota bacterium]
RHARSGRPGPVFLDIPTGVMENAVEGEVTAFSPSPSATARSVADPSQLKIAVEMLSRAERPLAIAGSGVWWSGAGEALRRFIGATQVPLLLSMMGRGAVPEDHPLCFGPLRVGCREADVILVVGARLNNWLGKGRPPLFGTGQRWVQVDIEAEEIGRNRPIDLALVGDARETLLEMTRLATGKDWGRNPSWLEELRKQARERRERMQGELTSDKVPIHPLRLCQEIQSFVARDATLITDGGDIAVFGGMALRVFEPGHWMDQANLGLLGSGIPFGLAAKLARPDKQVLVLIGDGSFGLNGMEMDTAVRHHLPIVVVVGNDAAWGMIKHRQEIIYGPERVVGTELRLTHYEEVVRALGGYGEYVERPQDIRPALERAFASGLPACINVATDPTVVSPLTRRTAAVRG